MQKHQHEKSDFLEKSEVGSVLLCDSSQRLSDPNNDFVFFDLEVDSAPVGRVVFRLFKSIAPKTCENFRQLCAKSPAGSSGKILSYKGTIIHKISHSFMIHGGDVVNFDGSGGESIYGPTFQDETYEVELEPGTLGMVNKGIKDSNSSQFFICCDKCPHLKGTNVAFGKVEKGFKIIEEISNLPNRDGIPLKKVVVRNCGELEANPETWHYEENDGLDQYPPYPEDLETSPDESSDEWAREMSNIVENIKLRGNHYFNSKKFEKALSKYTKAVRYLMWIKGKREDVYNNCTNLLVYCLSNMAITNINCQNFRPAHQLCSQVLELKPNNAKAFYRRGQANFGLHNYDDALRDLKEAQTMEPRDKKIYQEIIEVTNAMKQSKAEEIRLCANMLK
ncbi:peptidyl-prolyl cis-trans isomerase D-like [Thrips palmi]|uniref:peptidylprolyl isomerase n=1 Tax=Thrips palmi TaxID=161013 RepID=A0A6P9A157_THRPL|nr:peptidyl-prolyl cis-trans isomerase D-like [Thrips palmi]